MIVAADGTTARWLAPNSQLLLTLESGLSFWQERMRCSCVSMPRKLITRSRSICGMVRHFELPNFGDDFLTSRQETAGRKAQTLELRFLALVLELLAGATPIMMAQALGTVTPSLYAK